MYCSFISCKRKHAVWKLIEKQIKEKKINQFKTFGNSHIIRHGTVTLTFYQKIVTKKFGYALILSEVLFYVGHLVRCIYLFKALMNLIHYHLGPMRNRHLGLLTTSYGCQTLNDLSYFFKELWRRSFSFGMPLGQLTLIEIIFFFFFGIFKEPDS